MTASLPSSDARRRAKGAPCPSWSKRRCGYSCGRQKGSRSFLPCQRSIVAANWSILPIAMRCTRRWKAVVLAVDTNVLVYAADRALPFHSACRDRLERQRTQSGAWYTTWAILYEFLRVTTHPRVLRRPLHVRQGWDFVTALLESPGLSVLVATQRHSAVADEVFAELPHLAGNVLHDTHTAILMREHGIRRYLHPGLGVQPVSLP